MTAVINRRISIHEEADQKAAYNQEQDAKSIELVYILMRIEEQARSDSERLDAINRQMIDMRRELEQSCFSHLISPVREIIRLASEVMSLLGSQANQQQAAS